METALHRSLTDTDAALRHVLTEEGFGVLTEIDVSATLEAKLGVHRSPMKTTDDHAPRCEVSTRPGSTPKTISAMSHADSTWVRLRHSRSDLAEPGTDVILWARRPEQPLRPAS